MKKDAVNKAKETVKSVVKKTTTTANQIVQKAQQTVTKALKEYEIYPRVNGEAGLPYHYSIWQQEISVYKNIPIEAIKGFVK